MNRLLTLPLRALKKIAQPLGVGTSDYQNDRFEYILPHIQEKKVLDIGIVQHEISAIESEGWLHRLIDQYAEDTVGIDIDEEGIQYLQQEGYDARIADATAFDFNEEFDVIVAGELIEHLSDFDGFLQSVHENLKDDGNFILSTPNVFFFERFWSLFWNGDITVNSEHTCWFDEHTLTQLLDRYGFRVDEIHYTSGEWIYRNYRILPNKLRNTTIVIVAEPK